MIVTSMLSLALLAACDQGPSKTELAEARLAAATAQALAAPEVEPTADLGTQTFQTYCASCHGTEGKGDGPAAAALDPAPTDLTGPRPESLRGTPGGRRVAIADGIPGSTMVGYADVLTDEQLDAVVGFVHELRHGPGSAADCADASGGERAGDCAPGETRGGMGGGGMGGGGMGGGGMGMGRGGRMGSGG